MRSFFIPVRTRSRASSSPTMLPALESISRSLSTREEQPVRRKPTPS